MFDATRLAGLVRSGSWQPVLYRCCGCGSELWLLLCQQGAVLPAAEVGSGVACFLCRDVLVPPSNPLQAIVTGLRQSVKDFHHSVSGVTPQDVLELMLIVQYYDMLREVRTSAAVHSLVNPNSYRHALGGRGGGGASV